MPVPTTEPTSGELAAGHAERHAPAVASSPLTLEQTRKISQLSRPHRPGVEICAHARDATLRPLIFAVARSAYTVMTTFPLACPCSR